MISFFTVVSLSIPLYSSCCTDYLFWTSPSYVFLPCNLKVPNSNVQIALSVYLLHSSPQWNNDCFGLRLGVNECFASACPLTSP
jgi:hypothetical protein